MSRIIYMDSVMRQYIFVSIGSVIKEEKNTFRHMRVTRGSLN